MADDTNGDSGNRATVAQTLAEVRGLRDMTQLGFTNLQRQLDAVAGLPVAFARIEAQNKDQEKRITGLEKQEEQREASDDQRDRDAVEWRRTHLPTICLTLGLVIVAVVTLITQLH